MKPIAFITGVTGQDGSYLAKDLLERGWKVFGGFRRGSSDKTWRLRELGIENQVNLVDYAIGQGQQLSNLLSSENFSQIFHLAGESFTASSFDHPALTLGVNIQGAVELLEAVRSTSPSSQVFIAGSSEIFGKQTPALSPSRVTEDTRRVPTNPYGVSHLAILELARIFREAHSLNITVGILFNHESAMRSQPFLTRKISIGVNLLRIGEGEPLQLGNLDSMRDWGCAKEYVYAMQRLLETESLGDYIIATGSSTTVREVLRLAAQSAGFQPFFEGVGIDEKCIDDKTGQLIASVRDSYFRRNETPGNVGDTALLEETIGWKPSRTIEDVIVEMVETDYQRLLRQYNHA